MSLAVHPFPGPVSGRVRLPGSKSLTNRAILVAALTGHPVTLRAPLDSEDTRTMIEALRLLGREVDDRDLPDRLHLGKADDPLPKAEANLGVANAGTVARFLTAALATRPGGRYHLDGTPPMRRRPMGGLLDALAAAGTGFTFHGEPGHFPFTAETSGLRGGTIPCDASRSGQILSALLIAGTRAEGPLEIVSTRGTVSAPFVGMTIDVLRLFGARASQAGEDRFRVEPGFPDGVPAEFMIEPDLTAASYFLLLPMVCGGRLRLVDHPARSLQGDAAFHDLLLGAGLRTERHPDGLDAIGGPFTADIDADFNAFSDTFLTLAAAAPLLPGRLRIRGIGHTRHQETDRIAAMATELRRLGQQVEEGPDFLAVTPDPEAARRLTRDGPMAIETYRDHRVAMSFAILGCHDLHGDGRPWISIIDPTCTAKTYPRFFEDLGAVRDQSRPIHS